jgi:hypothetical protein
MPALLIADRVFREETTHKVHISGTFNTIKSPQYPFILSGFNIYAALTDLTPGSHVIKFSFNYHDTQSEMLRIEGSINAKDQLDVSEINFGLTQIIIPREWTIYLELHVDGEHVATRRIQLNKVPSGKDGK